MQNIVIGNTEKCQHKTTETPGNQTKKKKPLKKTAKKIPQKNPDSKIQLEIQLEIQLKILTR